MLVISNSAIRYLRQVFKYDDGSITRQSTDEDRELRLKVIRKLARRRVVGAHEKQVDTVKNWFATDGQVRVEDLIREMTRDSAAPLEGYGGSRDNVRLTSIEAATRYIEERGGELPWGLRDQ